MSIEWARIEPEKDHWDQVAIDHYKGMLVAMRERNLMPVVSLNHATLPLWVLTPPQKFLRRLGQNLLPHPLKDLPLADPLPSDPYWHSLRGWENYETVERFIRYVERIVLEFRDLVDYWITIGEPVATIIGGGYLQGYGHLVFSSKGKKQELYCTISSKHTFKHITRSLPLTISMQIEMALQKKLVLLI